ncbi:hypothetical protein GUITHDRAFT_139039 [Guillardia theta CCMP2712]|uniref:WW domain-containing protein n=1 Tax=Guillardia theta (strain CCMP2712) TaxID=905079 RepID=L1JBL3_GUITC|nr:hypothetical protein GUITHDRAFT_139039 [Guillardia theta CCMP2712]EKX45480.1 hypothetical protein GUITHDRAFT_139039 [Guillardia theta CCMP2712]|eukprot:XP_005832460.1 hypothetical protein GUITHDRAFT_139039 [Guillardia theta CCMP2712]
MSSAKKNFSMPSKSIWRKALDPNTNEIYFYHTTTKATQWDRPEDYDTEEDEAFELLKEKSKGGSNLLLDAMVGKILEYALYIGIDPTTEPHLLWIAEEGVAAELPEDYTQHTNKKGEVYYFNNKTKISQWEHPLDQKYKELVVIKRAEATGSPSQHEDGQAGLEHMEEVVPMTLVSKMAPPTGFLW